MRDLILVIAFLLPVGLCAQCDIQTGQVIGSGATLIDPVERRIEIINPDMPPILVVQGDTAVVQMYNTNRSLNGAAPGYDGKELKFSSNEIGFHFVEYETSCSKCVYVFEVVDSTNGSGVTRQVLKGGDSGTDNPTELNNADALFDGDVMTVNFIGTRDSFLCDNCANEGYGGKTFQWFWEDENSPFVFDGEFDFDQYLTSSEYVMNDSDLVILQLGANDMGLSGDCESKVLTALSYCDSIFKYIKLDRPNVRTVLGTMTPTSQNQAHWDADYPGTPGAREYVQTCAVFFTDQVLSRYPDANIDYIINYTWFVDTDLGMNNAYHFNGIGGQQMGRTLFPFLKKHE